MESYVLKTSDTLYDLLGKNNNQEKLFMLAGKKPKLAFRPISFLSMSWEDIDIEKIQDFCDKNQALNNLVFGFLSYNLGLCIHKINTKNKTRLPVVVLYSFENWIEENEGKITVKYRDKKFLTQVKEIAGRPKRNVPPPQLDGPFEPGWDIQQYTAAFDKVIKYIKAGDVYQINLSYPLTAMTKAPAQDIFTAAQKTNQVDMAGLFQASSFDLISFSPETFISIKDRYIETFPIKGTRSRTEGLSDANVTFDLINNQKENAELNMISDLLRNDLGIVCMPGSVKIKSRKKTTTLEKVIHTYSHIAGELDSDISSVEALLKIFPGGSISGCPKRRALEIIDELEEYSRGPYAGSLFTLDPHGSLESNILIRTLIKQNEKICLPVGGGIVFDSKSHSEYQETLDKSHSITNAFKS